MGLYRVEGLGFNIMRRHNPPGVDRIWGTWGSYYNITKAIFHLLKGHYRVYVKPTSM